jgi:hypothetical protein
MALMFYNELFAIEKFIVMFMSYEFVVAMNIGWKHGKIYTKSNVSNKILGLLKNKTNK